jgi:hypothetical protein
MTEISGSRIWTAAFLDDAFQLGGRQVGCVDHTGDL